MQSSGGGGSGVPGNSSPNYICNSRANSINNPLLSSTVSLNNNNNINNVNDYMASSVLTQTVVNKDQPSSGHTINPLKSS